MLENCVYDFFEMTALNMAQQGLFGEVLHGAGGYIHNLEPYWDEYQGNWRLDFNQDHRGDVYATHGFGPICQAMNIHRGDRLQTLVAFDTKSVNGLKLVQEKMRRQDDRGTPQRHDPPPLRPQVPADRYRGLRQQVPRRGLRIRA